MEHSKLFDLFLATASVGAIEAIDHLPTVDFMEAGKLLLQIFVAIGALITMFRKKGKVE